MRTYRSLVLAPVLLVASACPAGADDRLPFKGRAVEVVTSVEAAAGGILVTSTGAGVATQLGRFTREATVLIHPDGTFEGTVVFTAANGDQLTADLEGASTALPTLAGIYTFTDGTGRFNDVTGAADFVAVTSDGIHVALTFEGTIDV